MEYKKDFFFPFDKGNVKVMVSIGLDSVSCLGSSLHGTCQEFSLGANLKVRRCFLYINIVQIETVGS